MNKKKKGADNQTGKSKKDKGDKSEEETEELDPKTLRSRQLASKCQWKLSKRVNKKELPKYNSYFQNLYFKKRVCAKTW